jgi:hypothetical protein
MQGDIRPQAYMLQHPGVRKLLLRLLYSGRYSMAIRALWKDEVPVFAMAAVCLFVSRSWPH